MKSFEDKRKVISEKNSLKDHSIYSNVFIQHDQAQADRVLANNFRAILGAIKSHGLTVRGSHIVPRGSSERTDSPRDHASGDDNRRSGSGNRDNRFDNSQAGSRDGSPRRDQGRDSSHDDRYNGFRTVPRVDTGVVVLGGELEAGDTTGVSTTTEDTKILASYRVLECEGLEL
ncbi:hypothetical protein DPMN_042080 [Dreissena polymorpha]|uniref:Uncharacterized protein n=1 Tax=Dreissena polymorpha TaxID=45954 RepID=A0A9D4D0G2_DREPO|nr:hypothetical protein DPMN_042080 [Dreissena polymorpha]